MESDTRMKNEKYSHAVPTKSSQRRDLRGLAETIHGYLVTNAGTRIIVLTVHGSFNPVHKDHVRMMEVARHRVLRQTQTDGESATANSVTATGPAVVVVLGLMGITGESWLKSKGIREASQRFSNEQRIAMLEYAVEDRDWIFVADAAVSSAAHSSSHLIRKLTRGCFELERVSSIPETLRSTLGDGRVEWVQVMGSDTAESFGISPRGSNEIVVINRKPTTECNLPLCPSEQHLALQGLSSTAVRRAIDARDNEELEETVPDKVVKYLQQIGRLPPRPQQNYVTKL